MILEYTKLCILIGNTKNRYLSTSTLWTKQSIPTLYLKTRQR